MTREQFLLLKLSEECVEVAHRCSKQIQFGKDEKQRDQELTNRQRLSSEFRDLIAIASMLYDLGEIEGLSEEILDLAKLNKRSKMQKYLDKSAELGQLPRIEL